MLTKDTNTDTGLASSAIDVARRELLRSRQQATELQAHLAVVQQTHNRLDRIITRQHRALEAIRRAVQGREVDWAAVQAALRAGLGPEQETGT